MKAQNFDDLYKEAEAHDDYWLAGTVQEFTEEVFGLMKQKGVTRSELARRLGTSPAYVTKILRGNANFTLATMVRLARALDAELCVQLTPSEVAGRETQMPLEPQRRKGSGRGRPRSPGLAAAAPAATDR